MNKQDFTSIFLVDQSPEEVFNAINNVRGWWSEGVEGVSQQLNDEFVYRHKDLHYSKQRLLELVPNKKVVWLVIDSAINFVKNKREWNDTKITFEISKRGDKTQISFTHVGLVPRIECYPECSGGWNYYLTKSLLPLIMTGKGQPDDVQIAKVL
jgi:hypothetical protein